MRASVFCGVSVDGFIARRNGSFDFLPEGGGEPHGYTEFMETVDAIVMGRNTYDVVAAMSEWPYEAKPTIVLSHRPLKASELPRSVEQMSGTPEDIVSALTERGLGHVYVDGGITVQAFLRAGMIQSLTITRVPVLIGDGIPLFGAVPGDIRLRHIRTETYESGLVKSLYDVVQKYAV